MDQGDAAEDIRKIGNVDLMIAISQSKKQHSSSVMQAWVLANRHRGGEFFGCSFNYNLNVGQLVMDSWPLQRENWG
jgi:ABC-type phosphate transport system auxiliary subunit